MRRLIAVLILLVATLFTATPANAWWGRGWGFRPLWRATHPFAGRRWGYGGYGYGWGRPYVAYRRWGYPNYGAYPYYGSGGYGGGYYYAPSYSYPSYYPSWYGCYNTGDLGAGTTVGVGYPAYNLYASNPAVLTNLAMPSVAPRASLIAAAQKPFPAGPTFSYNAPTALALQQFLGLRVPQSFSPDFEPSRIAASPATPALAALDNILARVSTIEGRRKAERLIREGDELFRVQNFHFALQKYKLAASAAPDLPEALWRKGHALVATHNYELASTAFKRAIALTDDLGRDGFQLNDLYDSAAMTKAQHLESLAEWAVSRNQSSDPYFLLAVFLNYDGQTARAEKFFQKASDLAGISGGHIAVFLDPADDLPRVPSRPARTVPVLTVNRATEI